MKCYECDGVGYIPAYDLFSAEVEYIDTIEFYCEDEDVNLSLLAEAFGSDWVEWNEYLLCPWCDGLGK